MNCPTNALRAVTCCATVCIIALLAPRPAVSQDASPFNGVDLSGWVTSSGEPVTSGWEVTDGAIHLNKQEDRAGNIITDVEFGDFDLSFEFKIASGGNSGLKYRVRKFGGRTLGCEYQILDDPGASGAQPTKGSTGSLYDVYEPDAATFSLNPVDEFNSARIVVRGNLIQHWLNERLIVTAIVGDAEWEHRIADSKFSDVEGFGRNRFGKLMLTDHGSEVWYRNFRLQPVESAPQLLTSRPLNNGFGCCNQPSSWRRQVGAASYCRRGWFRRQ